MDGANVTPETMPWLMLGVAIAGQMLTALTFSRGGRQELDARFGKLAADESKSRHDLANAMQRVTDELRRDLKELERDAVRRKDLEGLEKRFGERFDKLETKLDRALERQNGGD